ncbi:MAG: hypothetical protein DWQ37_01370 [Planctomycetota bacterium]|nr:MAG: hypothetical protein DWQ37_01370 [Planctomycetota bacterium]
MRAQVPAILVDGRRQIHQPEARARIVGAAKMCDLQNPRLAWTCDPRLPAFCAMCQKGLRYKELAFNIVVFPSITKGDDIWKANSGRRL